MTNKRIGKIGAGLCGLAVLGFAISMIIGLFADTLFASCLICIFIAVSFVLFMAALYAQNADPQRKAAGLAGLLFAAIYAVLIFIVYYAQITTVRMNTSLGGEALSIISYGHAGSLFFNYDLLGYGFMALSTLLTGFCVAPRSKGDRAFRLLLWIHGIFFPCCLIMPMFPLFTPGTSDIIGTVVLEFWCVYFLPVCVLGWRYFSRGDR